MSFTLLPSLCNTNWNGFEHCKPSNFIRVQITQVLLTELKKRSLNCFSSHIHVKILVVLTPAIYGMKTACKCGLKLI